MFSKQRLFKELSEATNMGPDELRAWLRTDIAPITVANYKDAPSMHQSNKLLDVLHKTETELTATDCHFIQNILPRIQYLKRSKNRGTQFNADWENSLRNLGYDIRKQKKLKAKKSLQY